MTVHPSLDRFVEGFESIMATQKPSDRGRDGVPTTPTTRPAVKSNGTAPTSGASGHVQPRRADRRPEMIKQRRDERTKQYERQRQIRQWTRIGAIVVGALIVLGIAWTVYGYVTRTDPPGEKVSSSVPASQHFSRNEDGSVTVPEPYNSQPPTSGWHIGDEVAAWGVSKVQMEPAVFVHNLEHGGVMLQYNCECPETIALLERFADPATGYPSAVIAAPYADMETEVALTAWNHIWTMPANEVTPERLRDFIDGYVNKGPERIASQVSAIREWRDDDGAIKPWDDPVTG